MSLEYAENYSSNKDKKGGEYFIERTESLLGTGDWKGLYEFLEEHGGRMDELCLTERCRALVSEKAQDLTISTFEHNLDLLRRWNLTVYQKVTGHSGDDELLTLPRNNDRGSCFDLARWEGCKIRWNAGQYTPDQRAERILALFRKSGLNQAPVICIHGMGTKPEMEMVEAFTQTGGILRSHEVKIPQYVVEPDIFIFKGMMKAFPMDFIINSGRFFLFLGRSAVENLKNYLLGDEQNLLPEIFINLSPYPAADVSGEIVALSKRVSSESEEKRESVDKYYKSLTRKKWKRIFQCRERPLRVMGITNRFSDFVQYCTRDLLAGFERLGCITGLMIEREDTKRATDLYMHSDMLRFKPDLLICIGFNRDHFNISPYLPYVNWIQDKTGHLFRREAAENLNYMDAIMVQAKGYIPILESLGYRKVNHFPLGVDSAVYRPVKLSGSECQKYGCDISFVAGISEKPEEALETFIKKLKGSPAVKDVIQKFYEMIEKSIVTGSGCYGEQYEEFLCAAEKECRFQLNPPGAREALKENFLKEVGKVMNRVFPIRWLNEEGMEVHLYGKGWEKYPEFKPFARGFIRPGDELNKLYNASKITLRLHHYGTWGPSLSNPLATGTFCMANHIPKTHDLNPPCPELAGHLITFSGREDFLEKVRYYLENEEETREIARKCREIAIKKYEYTVMARRIIGIVRRSL